MDQMDYGAVLPPSLMVFLHFVNSIIQKNWEYLVRNDSGITAQDDVFGVNSHEEFSEGKCFWTPAISHKPHLLSSVRDPSHKCSLYYNVFQLQ